MEGVAVSAPTAAESVGVAVGCDFGVAVGRGFGVAVGASDETTARCGPEAPVSTGTALLPAQTRYEPGGVLAGMVSGTENTPSLPVDAAFP